MAEFAGSLYKKYGYHLREFHFWVAFLLLGLIALFYYQLQFSWQVIISLVPFIHTFAIWEYTNNIVGSLFYIPLLYSLFFLSWRRILVIWLLSVFLILPRLIFFYYTYTHSFGRIVIDVFYLSIPVLILISVNLELKWRNKEKRFYEEREKERQGYLAQIFKAQEEERKRLAREIHDDPIQRLSVIAGNAKRLVREEHLENQPVLKKKVESIQNMIIDVSQDLRRITLDLRPTVLDDLGLIPALRWLADNFKQETGINTRIMVIGSGKFVSNKVSINVFRIVQEALNNIKRHAGATEVQLDILFTSEMIKVTVQDNGRGFILPREQSELTAKGKLGIIGMQQRAQLINGDLHCHSHIGQGTAVSLSVNLADI